MYMLMDWQIKAEKWFFAVKNTTANIEFWVLTAKRREDPSRHSAAKTQNSIAITAFFSAKRLYFNVLKTGSELRCRAGKKRGQRRT